MIKVAPSIVSAPFINLVKTITELNDSSADWIHFDIEDGAFVPVMNLGVKSIRELRPLTQIPFDVHLMMIQPEWIIQNMAQFGTNRLSVHYEAVEYPRRVLKKIVESGMEAGLAFNPKTAIPDLRFCEPYLSFIVLLTTEPEDWTGSYLPTVLDKIRKNKPLYPDVSWVVDGGVSLDNIKAIYSAGADEVVSGREIFKDDAIKNNIQNLKLACENLE